MNAESIDVSKIRALDFWRGPLEVEPLAGGITNRNYLVREGQRRLVVRLCSDLPLLGVDRRNEVTCQRAAHACGIAPEVVYHEAGVLVSEFLPGRTLAVAEFADPETARRLATVLRQLHDSWDHLTGEMLYFSPFQAVQTYAATARRLGASLPSDVDGLLADSRRLARAIPPFRPVLCHNDLLPANVLDDGRAIRLVDWEYAGIGHPLFDLANLAGNCGLDDAQEADLLAAYRGRVGGDEREPLRIFRAASLLREALWSAIQTIASTLDFDYHAYAAANFTAYRRARERIRS